MTGQQEASLLIAGAGFGGLIMALEARKRGIKDIVILEKARDVGGTWRENTYPGVACDVPSHLYSMAAYPNPDWTTAYAGGAEIQAYVQRIAKREGLYDLCRFGRTFRSAHWDGQRWQIETEEGETWSARVFVSALGPLHVPLIPELTGAESFAGPSFHSARWDHGVDLTGARVAVIGTGASAVQFVPEIAKTAARVSVFQRSAPYVLPRPDGPIPPWMRTLHRVLPFTRQMRRQSIYHMMEMRHAVFMGREKAVNFAMKLWRKEVEKSIADETLRRAVTPEYRIGCKRILSSNDWYPALARENVDLIASGVDRIEGNRIVATSGEDVTADVLIWGTGFEVTGALERMNITGENGLSLPDVWKDGIAAHLGVAVAGFPNLFLLLGPNTGLGHNSVLLMIEAQVEHICRMLQQMSRDGIPAICPRSDAQTAFAEEMADRLSATVWQSGGCASWYQDSTGRNPVLWPGTVGEYSKRMRSSGIEHYRPVAVSS